MLVASFVGSNREFRAYLAARTANVISLAWYRYKKKAAKRAAQGSSLDPIIA